MNWPASLPPFLLQMSRTPRPNVISFGTEVGPGKVRRRSTARSQVVSGTLLLTRDQVEDFESFFQDDLLDGSRTFTMADPVTKVETEWRFDSSNPYSMSRVTPSRWRVEATLMSV